MNVSSDPLTIVSGLRFFWTPWSLGLSLLLWAVIAAVLLATHIQRVATFHDDKHREGGEDDKSNCDFHGVDLQQWVKTRGSTQGPHGRRPWRADPWGQSSA